MKLYFMQTMITGRTTLILIDEILYNKIENKDQDIYKLYSKDKFVEYENKDQLVTLLDPVFNKFMLCYLKQYDCPHGRIFLINDERYHQIEK